jgi:hypothetical protein
MSQLFSCASIWGWALFRWTPGLTSPGLVTPGSMTPGLVTPGLFHLTPGLETQELPWPSHRHRFISEVHICIPEDCGMSVLIMFTNNTKFKRFESATVAHRRRLMPNNTMENHGAYYNVPYCTVILWTVRYKIVAVTFQRFKNNYDKQRCVPVLKSPAISRLWNQKKTSMESESGDACRKYQSNYLQLSVFITEETKVIRNAYN